jgi:hypothetical protein
MPLPTIGRTPEAPETWRASHLRRAASEKEGSVEFERRWGGQTIPLAYDYWPELSGLNVGRRDRGSIAAMGQPAPTVRQLKCGAGWR